jgi:hypothetical protein
MKRRSLFGALLAGIAAPAVAQLPKVAPSTDGPVPAYHWPPERTPRVEPICWAMYDPPITHAHTHSVNDPGHSHQLWDASHNHSVSDPGHSHALTYPFVGEVRAFSSLAAVPAGWKVCDGMNGTPDLRHRGPLRT